MKVLLIIPAYNEAENIASVVNNIIKSVQQGGFTTSGLACDAEDLIVFNLKVNVLEYVYITVYCLIRR